MDVDWEEPAAEKFKSWDLSQRTHHNSLSPICNAFPSELLAEVFAYLSISEKPGSYHIIKSHMFSATREILGWIKVTHVCRHWRNVALDYPSLWGHISYQIGPEWTKLMMERVKAAPITLKQRWSTKCTIALGEEDYIPSRIGQIEELELYGHPVDLRKIFAKVQSKAAPKLKTLCIHSVHRENSPESLMFQIQDNLFLGGKAPLLRTVSITNCRLSWTSPLLYHLTFMGIHQEKGSPVPPPTVDELFDVLERLPQLRSLSLEHSVPSFSALLQFSGRTLTSRHRTVNLPELEALSLDGDHSDCLSLLQTLSFPPYIDVSMRLQPSFTPAERPHVKIIQEIANRVKTMVKDKLLPISRAYIRAPRMAPDTSHEPHIQLLVELPRRHINSARERSYRTSFNLEFDLEDDTDDPVFWDIAPIVNDFLHLMPLDGVEVLDMQVVEELYLSPPELMDILHGMSKTLRSLRIAGTVAFGLPNVLNPSFSGPTFLPRLKDLTLFDFDFQVAEGTAYIRLLLNALGYRTKLDPARILHMLSFKDCYFAVGGVPTLEEFKGCTKTLLLPREDELHNLDCSEDYVAIEDMYPED